MEEIMFAIIAFFIVYFSTPLWIKYLKIKDMTVVDMQKKDKPLVPLSAGIPIFFGLYIFLMLLIFYQIFIEHQDKYSLSFLFAGIISLFIFTLIGFFDDLLIPANKLESKGLKQWQKPLLTLVGAIPLLVINAGTSQLIIPLFGRVDLGIFYSLLFIPLVVVTASNMVNMFAGYNGLETGLGIIYFGSLGLFALAYQRYLAAVICLAFFSTLLALIFYTWYPSKILPGDSLTYMMGGGLAVVAILGNIERAVAIVSIPFFIEFILKMRGKFKIKSFGYLRDGKIHSYYKKIYSIPHILARTGKFTEKQIVIILLAMEFVLSLFIWV